MPIVEFSSRQGRLIVLVTVLASGVAFLDATVVTVALPRIGDEFSADLSVLQWVLDAYLLTLGALVLVGGALGDVLGKRRVFVAGMVGFAVASLLCAVAWDSASLIGARALQGVFAALLVPASLAILSASFTPGDRGRAIGAWSGLSGISTAIGPFLGGWLVDAVSWRWVFLLNLPLLAVAIVVAQKAVPADAGSAVGLRRRALLERVDLPGAGLTVLGLALIVTPLIEIARLPAWLVAVLVVLGGLTLASFVAYERRRTHPMLPPNLFRIRTSSVANLVTFVVYGALTAMGFLITLGLQRGLDYSALAAGAATVPITLMMLAFSPRVGGLLPRLGARPLLAAGGAFMTAGLLMLSGMNTSTSYLTGVLPGVLVFSVGLVLIVTPVTTTALTDVPNDRQGVASGGNNAVARIAGLVAIAVLPAAAGMSAAGAMEPGPLLDGISVALRIAAASTALGGLIAWFGLRAKDSHKAPKPLAADTRAAD